MNELGILKTAIISPDGFYRYRLGRLWTDKRPILSVCMLNPSTADAKIDDPTIRKLYWYAGLWHYGGFEVVNMCAARTPKPVVLFQMLADRKDIIGPENYKHMRLCFSGRDVLCAWGDGVKRLDPAHVAEVKRTLVTRAERVYCLGLTASGNPVHPLYQPKNVQPRTFHFANG